MKAAAESMHSRFKRARAAPANDRRSSAKALDLDNYVPAFFTYLANKISSSASAAYRPKFGVGITDWRLMAQLAVEPWVVAARLCEATGLDKAAVSRSVRQLARRGLVEVCPHATDQRRQLIALSRKGLALHDRIVDVSRERERRLLAALSAEERMALVGLLRRLRSQVAAASARAPEKR
jgi:DNA-binding MarR family transcriptional regulator